MISELIINAVRFETFNFVVRHRQIASRKYSSAARRMQYLLLQKYFSKSKVCLKGISEFFNFFSKRIVRYLKMYITCMYKHYFHFQFSISILLLKSYLLNATIYSFFARCFYSCSGAQIAKQRFDAWRSARLSKCRITVQSSEVLGA